MLDAPEPSPSHFDVLLTDIHSKDLHTHVAQLLHIQYLANSSSAPTQTVNGIIYGINHRLFVSLSLQLDGSSESPKDVIFLVATGSPFTYICEEVIAAFKVLPQDKLRGTMNGFPREVVYLSPPTSHFKDINIIGSDFFFKYKVKLDLLCYFCIGKFHAQQLPCTKHKNKNYKNAIFYRSQDNLRRTFRYLPIRFVQGILVHIQSCAVIPDDVDSEWFVDRLVHEVEAVGLELFIQKLDPGTVQESCSLLNLGANEEELSQLQVSLETYAKDKRPSAFLASTETEVLERDLKIHHKLAAPKEEIEDTLIAEILLLGLEGLLEFLTIPILREFYTALRIGTTAPVVLKKRQLIEEIVLHSFDPRFDGTQTVKIKTEPIEIQENDSDEDNNDEDYEPYKENGDKESDDKEKERELLSTPKTPYSTPRRPTAADIQRNTPRKELDKMLVKDLRQYLQTQGLKYDDKRSVLLNRILRHHRSDAGPATPLDEELINSSIANNNNNHKNSTEDEETHETRGEPSSRRKSKRFAPDSDSACISFFLSSPLSSLLSHLMIDYGVASSSSITSSSKKKARSSSS